MSLKENLIKKKRIDLLSSKIKRSISSSVEEKKMDKASMVELLEMAGGTHKSVRDLDLYYFDSLEEKEIFLILDNELKIYSATTYDAVMRKSPTIREMISLGNIKKILSDKDIVLFRADGSIDWLYDKVFKGLDLSYDEKDLDELVMDGKMALKEGDEKSLLLIMELFAELLSYEDVTAHFLFSDRRIFGRLETEKESDMHLEPVLIINLQHQQLFFFNKKIKVKAANIIDSLFENEEEDDQEVEKDMERVEGSAVLLELKRLCMEKNTSKE